MIAREGKRTKGWSKMLNAMAAAVRLTNKGQEMGERVRERSKKEGGKKES